MTPPIQTIEDILDMSLEQLVAMTPDEITEFIRPALAEQEAILGTLPHSNKKSTGISMTPRNKPSAQSISPDAAALVSASLLGAGLDLDMLRKAGIKV